MYNVTVTLHGNHPQQNFTNMVKFYIADGFMWFKNATSSYGIALSTIAAVSIVRVQSGDTVEDTDNER